MCATYHRILRWPPLRVVHEGQARLVCTKDLIAAGTERLQGREHRGHGQAWGRLCLVCPLPPDHHHDDDVLLDSDSQVESSEEEEEDEQQQHEGGEDGGGGEEMGRVVEEDQEEEEEDGKEGDASEVEDQANDERRSLQSSLLEIRVPGWLEDGGSEVQEDARKDLPLSGAGGGAGCADEGAKLWGFEGEVSRRSVAFMFVEFSDPRQAKRIDVDVRGGEKREVWGA